MERYCQSFVARIGLSNNCTYCGVLRRQALDRGARLLQVDKIVTCHNADDIAETVLMNSKLFYVWIRKNIHTVLRGDIARLNRCVSIKTNSMLSTPLSSSKEKIMTKDYDMLSEWTRISRCKPFKYVYEKEIVMYAHYRKLCYFSTECIYSPNAYRGYVREFIKDLERENPQSILGSNIVFICTRT